MARFLRETTFSQHGRIFYLNIINQMLLSEESFSSVLSLSVLWVHMQLKKKYEALGLITQETEQTLQTLLRIGTMLKSECIMYLRKIVLRLIDAQDANDWKQVMIQYNKVNGPTLCLLSADIITYSSLKHYYITGSLQMLKMLYENTKEDSPQTRFIVKGCLQIHRSLFVPSYPPEVFDEIKSVLNDFEGFIEDTDDEMLLWNYRKLMEFLNEDLDPETLKKRVTPTRVTSYPASLIYLLFWKFYQLVPSEAHTINSCGSPVHKIFYLYIYMIGRVLDNVFPEARYFTQFRFIGVTTVYPYTMDDLNFGMTPELRPFLNYGNRLMAYFVIRDDLFNKYLTIDTPFPERLAENRFKSRKLKVHEEFVTKFRETVLKPWNYPQVGGGVTTPVSDSSRSTESFSSHFNSAYAFDLGFERALSLEEAEPQMDRFEVPRLDQVDPATGFLLQDYDPKKDLHGPGLADTVTTIEELRKYQEDREGLMKMFIET